jgi:hypothetical protein
MADKSNSSYLSQQNRASTRVIAILLGITVLSIIIAIIWPQFTRQATERDALVALPRITTGLNSHDAASMSVTAVFVIETGADNVSGIDREVITSNIRAILAYGDYDMLTGRTSVEYTKDLIRERLPDMMDISDIDGIYLVDLQAGNPNTFFSDGSEQQNNTLNDFLRGIRFR